MPGRTCNIAGRRRLRPHFSCDLIPKNVCLSAVLESVREGPRFGPDPRLCGGDVIPAEAGITAEGLPYRDENSLPFGTAWNTAANYGQYKSGGRWAEEQSGVRLATTIEIPYANVGAAVVTADNARAFGRDLARAIRRYLESGDK